MFIAHVNLSDDDTKHLQNDANKRTTAGTRPKLTYPPIAISEVKEFAFDSYYTKCKLMDQKNFFVTKEVVKQDNWYNGYNIKVFPIKVPEDTYALFAALNFQMEGSKDPNELLRNNWIARATCIKGKVVAVRTQPEASKTGVQKSAGQCGLASLLAYLCMVDDDVGAGKGFDIAKIGKDKQFKGIVKFWLKIDGYCEKVIYLINGANPKIGARAYLNAAMDANFPRIYTFIAENEENQANPNKGVTTPLDTADAINLYKNEEDADVFITKYGAQWFFCKPKK